MKKAIVLWCLVWVILRFSTLQNLLDHLNSELTPEQQNTAKIINGVDEHSSWFMGNWILVYNK